MKISIQFLVNLFFVMLSIAYCVMAPNVYNLVFCQIVALTYVVHNVSYFALLDRKNWLGFELFFCLSFFFVNYVYPVFIYPIFPNFAVFSYAFELNIVPKATAIAYLGYSCYLLGCTSLNDDSRKENVGEGFKVTHMQLNIALVMVLFFFVCYILTGGLAAMRSVYADGGDINEVGLYSYFKLLFTISSYLLAVFTFKLEGKTKWWYVASLVMIMFMMLTTGSRTLVIGLSLIMIVSFNNNVRKIRLIEFAVIVVVGVLVLYSIMLDRGEQADTDISSVVESSDVGWLEAFLDLIVNNRNLYVLIDYASSHPFTFFHGMLVDLTAPIPGVSSMLVAIFNEPIELLHGGMLPTYLEFGTGSSYGLGTNMVGEAYRSFGYPGTAIMMFAIGYVVSKTYYLGKSNMYMYMLYYLLVSHSIMYTRGPIIMDLRLITWTMALLYITTCDIRIVRKEAKK